MNQEEGKLPGGKRRGRRARGRNARRRPDLSFGDEGTGLEEEAVSIEAPPEAEIPREEVSPPLTPSEEDKLRLTAKRRFRRAPKEKAGRARIRGGGFPVIIPLIIGSALATLVVTIFYTRVGSVDFSNFVFFLAIYSICSLFDLKLKSEVVLNLGLAPLLAAMIALPAVEVAWVFLFGTIIMIIIKKLGELNRDDILGLLLDFTGVGVMVVVYQFLVRVLPKKPELHGNYWPGILIAAAIAACLLLLEHVVRATYQVSQEGQFPAAVYFSSILRKYWIPFLTVGFIGVLMGLIFIGIGIWSVLFLLPLLIIFVYSYNRIAATDQYLLETIRTLALIPEETGMVPKGHAERVACLSAGVARELGLSPEDVQQVEYAAYLHDIGAITGQKAPDVEQQQLLETEGVIAGGVDIVGKVDYLEVAAEILRGREGLRDRVEDVDKRRAVSLGAGILKAVDDFESLVQGYGDREPISQNEALTEMNLERGVRYDSKVLRAIARMLPRLPKEVYSSSAEGSPEGSTFWGEPES